jgi:hypothetical protein
MSIKERVNRPEVRPVIDSLFPKPQFKTETPIVQPSQTDNYAEIGAAFNYMFSFWLAANNNTTAISRWPTTAGLNSIEAGYEEYADDANERIDAAERALARYTETGIVDDSLCRSALDLARIEAAYNGDRPRALHLLRRLGNQNPDDINDLRGLTAAIPDEFRTVDAVTVNPEFGPVEFKVGGVDADIICDGTLLDLKTTKDPTLKINYWRKLVAYATLAEVARSFSTHFEGSFTDVELPEIENVGVYFSRYATVWKVSTTRIYEQEQYSEFRDWFINVVSD